MEPKSKNTCGSKFHETSNNQHILQNYPFRQELDEIEAPLCIGRGEVERFVIVPRDPGSSIRQYAKAIIVRALKGNEAIRRIYLGGSKSFGLRNDMSIYTGRDAIQHSEGKWENTT